MITKDLTRMWMCGLNAPPSQIPCHFGSSPRGRSSSRVGHFALRSHNPLLQGAQADWYLQEIFGACKSLSKGGGLSVDSGVLSGGRPGAGEMAKEAG